MLTLVRTEMLKLTTTRWPWGLIALALAVTLILALQPVYKSGRDGDPTIGTVLAELAVLNALSRGALVALLLGVLLVTSEFRHNTVTASLLQSPRRGRVVAAKALIAASVGLVLGLAALAIVLAVGLGSGAIQQQLINGDIVLRVVGLVLTYPLYALLGTATGCLIPRNQPLAVVIPVLWLAGLEALALSSVPQSLRVWSLLGTTAALQNAGDVPLVLPIWAGAGALIGYGLLLLGAGALRIARADIS